MINRFPRLPGSIIDDLNILGRWLAQNDFNQAPETTSVDVLVLAGNAVIPTIEGAFAFAQTGHMPILISGGIGHSTGYLYQTLCQHPQYRQIATGQRTEADILAEIAVDYCGIDQDRLIIENQSTHCGENAQFSLASLINSDCYPQSGLLIQDPTMQRRTQATFERACQKAHLPQVWRSWSPIQPQLVGCPEGVGFIDAVAGLWDVERYIGLLCGELPRIIDDQQGYGPCGRDYLVHVDIPEQVAMAWDNVANNKDIKGILAARAIR